MKFILGKIENIVGKEVTIGRQHFSSFSKMFSIGCYFKVIKTHGYNMKELMFSLTGYCFNMF